MMYLNQCIQCLFRLERLRALETRELCDSGDGGQLVSSVYCSSSSDE